MNLRICFYFHCKVLSCLYATVFVELPIFDSVALLSQLPRRPVSIAAREICCFCLPLSLQLLPCSLLLSGILKGASRPLLWGVPCYGASLTSASLAARSSVLLLLACLFWPGSSLSDVTSSIAEGWCFSISKQRVKKVSPCNFLGSGDALLMWSKAVIIPVSLGSERVDECGRDGEEISLWATGGVNSQMLTYM